MSNDAIDLDVPHVDVVEEYTFSHNYHTDEDVSNDDTDIDPEHLIFKQNSFQDEIVDNIFNNIITYIRETAAPICEYLTREDVELIISEILN